MAVRKNHVAKSSFLSFFLLMTCISMYHCAPCRHQNAQVMLLKTELGNICLKAYNSVLLFFFFLDDKSYLESMVKLKHIEE